MSTVLIDPYRYSVAQPGWILAYGENQDAFSAVSVGSDGSIYIVGTDDSLAPDAVLVKVSSAGAVVWHRKLSRSTDVSVTGSSLALDSSDNVYVVCTADQGSSVYATYTVKYNSSGSIQWQRRITNGINFRSACVTDATGNVYVASATSTGANNGKLMKYDASGTLQWQRQQSLSGRFRGVCVDSSANVYVSGHDNNRAITLSQYDTSGTLLYQKKIADTISFTEGGHIACDGASYLYVVGSRLRSDFVTRDAYVAKLDLTGVIQWQYYFSGLSGRGCSFTSVFYDSSGFVYAVGDEGTTTPSQDWSWFIVKLDTSGTVIWQRKFREIGSTGVNTRDAYKAITSGVGTNFIVVSKFLNFAGPYPVGGGAFYLPANGTGSGSYGTDNRYTYSSIANTVTAASFTLSTTSFTSSNPGDTEAAGDLTDSAGSATYDFTTV